MRDGPLISFITGWETGSTLWNIFIALRVFVDHSKITPSQEPDAKRLAGNTRKDRALLGGVCGLHTHYS